MPTPQSCYWVPASSKADNEGLVRAQQDTHLTRSMPSKASDSEAGSLVTTASLATHTPCSLAPISAPQSQEGLLSTTAWVFGTCSISMYVHCRDSRKKESQTITSPIAVTEATQDFNVQKGHTLFKRSVFCERTRNFLKQYLRVMFKPSHPHIAEAWENTCVDACKLPRDGRTQMLKSVESSRRQTVL